MNIEIKNLLKNQSKYIIGINQNRETDKNNFYLNYKGYDDSNEYNNVLRKGGSNFEYIRLNSIVKPYIDYDAYYNINTPNKQEFKKIILNKLVNIFIQCCNVKLNCDLNESDIVILDGSRSYNRKDKQVYKYSFHITTKNNKSCFKSQQDAKIICELMKTTEYEIYGNNKIYENTYDGKIEECIDKSVYGKTQRFRTIYGSKYKNCQNSFKPVNINAEVIVPKNPIVYLVCYHEDDYKLITVQDNKYEKPYEQTEDSTAVIFSKLKNYQCSEGFVNLHSTGNTHEKNKPIITDYKKDIELFLIKKGIIKPVFVGNSIYANNIMYKFCYADNGKCIYGNTHNRNSKHNATIYAYVKNGVILCGCYGSTCKTNNKNKVIIGSILEKSPLENSINAIQCNQKYLTPKDDKYNKICQTFSKFMIDDDKKVLCVKSRCGTGKTYSMTKYINLYLEKKPKARILMISTRQSYARAMCKRNSLKKDLGLISYLEYKENDGDMNDFYKLQKVCISLESLHYFKKGWIPYDIIILDESESICRQFFSTTIKEGSVSVYFFLQKLMLNQDCKKIFCLDADLSTPTLTLINCIDSEKRMMINNTYNSNKREYYMSQDEKDWTNDVKSKLLLGKKIFIVCLSEEKACDLHNEFDNILKMSNEMNGVKNINNGSLLITGNMDENIKREMADVNELWKNKGLVITTSATGAGIDFTLDHFDFVYGYIYAGLSPPAEFLQICHRVRKPKNNKIYVMCNSKMRLPEYTYDLTHNEIKKTNSFIFTVINAKKYIDTVKQTVITNPVLKSVYNREKGCMTECAEEWNPDYSKLQYYEYLSNYLNNQASNYLLVLKLLIEQHGDKCIMNPVKAKQTRKKNKHNKLNETKINGIDFIELKHNKHSTTNVNRNQFDKNKMCKLFRIKDEHCDDDLIDICNVYTKQRHIYNQTKGVHMNEETKNKVSKDNNPTMYDTINNKSKQNLMMVYKNFMDISKYDYSKDHKIEIKRLEEIYNELNITTQQMMSITRNRKMVHNKVILTVLRNFGLTLKTHRTRVMIDNKYESKTSHYSITPTVNIYNCLYMELYKVKGYDETFMNNVNTYKEYEDIIDITKHMKKQQKLSNLKKSLF
jgi:hypothetical protein